MKNKLYNAYHHNKNMKLEYFFMFIGKNIYNFKIYSYM